MIITMDFWGYLSMDWFQDVSGKIEIGKPWIFPRFKNYSQCQSGHCYKFSLILHWTYPPSMVSTLGSHRNPTAPQKRGATSGCRAAECRSSQPAGCASLRFQPQPWWKSLVTFIVVSQLRENNSNIMCVRKLYIVDIVNLWRVQSSKYVFSGMIWA